MHHSYKSKVQFLKISQTNFENSGTLKNSVFLYLPILDLFPKKENASFLWKSVKGSWISRMEQNFDNYPDFQPKITHLKHFSHQCISFLLEAQIVRKFWRGLCPDYFLKNADVCIPETPPPLMSANICNWVPPPPLKVADVLCGRPLKAFAPERYQTVNLNDKLFSKIMDFP